MSKLELNSYGVVHLLWGCICSGLRLGLRTHRRPWDTLRDITMEPLTGQG